MSDPLDLPTGVAISAPTEGRNREVLSREALEFFATLQREFNPRRLELLEARKTRQKEIDGGKLPDFLPETADIRNGDWTVDAVPADLQD